MAVLNGRLPATLLGTVAGTAQRLRADVVPQTEALRAAFAAAFGRPLRMTDGYRDFDAQVRVRAQKGVYAAVPGTSVHGLGLAADWGSGVEIDGSAEFEWMKANAPRFGWTHPLWAEDGNPANGQQEPWHWEAAPVPPSSYEEEDDMAGEGPTILAVVEELRERLIGVEGTLNRKIDEVKALAEKGTAREVWREPITDPLTGERGAAEDRLAYTDRRVRDLTLRKD